MSGAAFVTGGSGFIGANLVRVLLARGWRVRCAVRATSPTLALDGLPIERVVVDLTDPAAVAAALAGTDAVFHVAGVYDTGPDGIAAMRRVHVDATRAILDGMARAGVRRGVLCSSSITVGYGPRDAPGDEDTALDPDVYGRAGPLRAYHDTKAEAERLARDADVEMVIVNPDYTIGAWDLKPTSGAMIVHLAKRPIPVWPRGGKCFVDAEDCALGHLLAWERGAPGRRYLLGVHNRSYREFMTAVARAVGRRPPLLPLPRALTRVVPVPLLRAMQAERYRSGRRAIDELGLPVRPLEDSIATALRWFRDHGYCP